MCFNPRAHMGRDAGRRVCCHRSPGFNPRAHMGRDRAYLARANLGFSFNPRAHMGRDIKPRSLQHFRRVSIHAPTWGATRS